MSGTHVKTVRSKLEVNGFVPVRQARHGTFYKHKDGRITVVSMHYKGGIIPVGTLKSIEKATGLRF